MPRRASERRRPCAARGAVAAIFLAGWLCASALAQPAGEPRGRRLILDDFEDPQWGNLWSTLRYDLADPELYPVRDVVHGGRVAGRVRVEPGGFVHLLLRGPGLPAERDADHPNWAYFDARPPRPMLGKPQAVGLWVHGRGGGERLRIQVADRSGSLDPWRTFDLGTVDFEGWRLLRADLAGEPVSGGRLEGKYPWYLGRLEIDRRETAAAEGAAGDLILDDLTLWTVTHDAFAFGAERYSGQLADRPCVAGEPFEVRVWADNLTDRPLEVAVGYRVLAEGPTDGGGAETRPSGEVRLTPDGGARAEGQFSLALPAGVYRIELTASGAGESRSTVLAGVPVFPAEGLDSRVPEPVDVDSLVRRLQGNDLFWITGSLSPGALVWTSRPALSVFNGLDGWGLGGPTHLAVPMADGIVVVRRGEPVPLDRMSEPWLLAWYHGAEGWTQLTEKSQDGWRGRRNMNMDAPWLIVLQRRPTGLHWPDRQGGLSLQFDLEAGYAVLTPYFGAAVVPAERTAAWAEGLPPDVAAQCRRLAEASHHFPIEVTESFAIDFIADAVHVRERVRYVSFRDAWGGEGRKYAPLPPMMGLALRAGCPFLSFSGEPVDLGVPTSVGPWYGVPDVDEYAWTLRGLLPYVTTIDTPTRVHLEHPRVREAYEAVTWQLRGPASLDWYLSGNMNGWVPNSALALQFLEEPLREQTRQYLRWATLQTVVPNNLRFHWDGRAIRGSDGLAGYDVAYFNPANYGVFAAYALASEDRELLRGRWRYHHSLLTNFASAPWDTLGWPGGLAGEGFFDFVISAMNHARLSHMVGDGEGYRYGIFLATRGLLAYYAAGMGATDYVRSLSPWPMLDMRIQQDPRTGRFLNGPDKRLDQGMMSYENWVLPVADWEDLSFTDSWGGNLGLGPWANLVRPGDAYHEGIARFWRDHMNAYARYWIDGRYRKFMPEWYDAVVVRRQEPDPAFQDRRTGQPVWFEKRDGDGMQDLGDNRHMNLRLRRLILGEGVDELAATYHAMRSSRTGSIWAVLEAGADWELRRLAPMPRLEQGTPVYELASQREGGGGGVLRSLWTHAMTDRSWPVLVYYGWIPPKMPEGLGATDLGVLPGCGYVRTAESDRIVQVDHQVLTWNCEVRTYRLESVTPEDARRARELRERLPRLRHLVPEGFRGDVDATLAAAERDATAAWQISGPFHQDQRRSGFETDYGPEGVETIDYAATYEDDFGRRLGWRTMRMADFRLDFRSALTTEPDVLAYAATQVWAPREIDVYLLTGTDDGVRIWVNGQLVHEKRDWRAVKVDEDVVQVRLRAGWNRVLVKVDQGEGEWGFALRFADLRYRLPIPELRINPNGG